MDNQNCRNVESAYANLKKKLQECERRDSVRLVPEHLTNTQSIFTRGTRLSDLYNNLTLVEWLCIY